MPLMFIFFCQNDHLGRGRGEGVSERVRSYSYRTLLKAGIEPHPVDILSENLVLLYCGLIQCHILHTETFTRNLLLRHHHHHHQDTAVTSSYTQKLIHQI